MTTAAPPDAVPGTLLAFGFHNVLVADLRPHKSNIRKNLGDLTELAGSIAANGVLEPLLVTQDGYVVCGHRRLAAAISIGEQRVPCVVREMSLKDAIEAMLVENLQRSDITALEEANAYQELLNLGESADEIAASVSLNADRIRRRAALLQLPNAARELLETHRITIGAAEELLQLKGHPEEIERLINGAGFTRGVDRGTDTPTSTFGWQLGEAKNRIKIAEARVVSVARAEKDGLKVVDKPKWDRKPTQPIALGNGYDELPVKAKEHAKLDCHAVYIDNAGKLQPVCTKPKNHPDAVKKADVISAPNRKAEQERREADQRRRTAVIVSLKAYLEAHPTGSAELHALVVMAQREGGYINGDETICKLLGIVELDASLTRRDAQEAFAAWLVEGATVIRGAMPVPEFARLQRARVAIDLAQMDEAYNDGNLVDDNAANAWMLFLKGLGNELDEDEEKTFDVERVLRWADSPAKAFAGNF